MSDGVWGDGAHRLNGPRAAAILLLAAPILWPLPAAAQVLYSIARGDNVLRVIDPATGATIADDFLIEPPGGTVTGGNGLAKHPSKASLYALVRTSGGFPTNRTLIEIRPLAGTAQIIGDTGDRFAGLAFDSSGTLYAVTGDGAATPESLYTLSLTDATPTFVVSLGNGGDGEAIGFNPNDGFLYHTSGVDDGLNPDTRIFERIDLNSLTVTNIPISGDGYSEITALVFSGNSFFAADTLGPILSSVTDGGAFSTVGSMDHVSKGLAFSAPAPVPALGGWGLAVLVVFLVLTPVASTGWVRRRARAAR